MYDAFHYPFEALTNAHEEALERFLFEWVGEHGMLDERVERVLRASRFSALTARAYPRAAPPPLELVGAWTVWLFLQDDRCDEARLGRRAEALRREVDRYARVLQRAIPPSTPLETSLADVRDRLASLGAPGCSSRFGEAAQAYFDACVWEAGNREAGGAPDVATYRRMRRHTGGVSTCLALIEVTDDVRLPLEARSHPTLRGLGEAANDVICLSNDVFSAEKELRQGDVHNLTILTMREQGSSFAEAVAAVTRLHDAELRRFLALEAALPSFGGRYDRDVERYVLALKAWMCGNLEWSKLSGRYRPGRAGL
ncbi:MAG: hypothetical protein MUF34_12365 [Polyangiaceae bacterium]|jgi:Terpene synthase family 2, C-terminal metal binding|nr:hypothetical protein [Polyangiaceae bacterium]